MYKEMQNKIKFVKPLKVLSLDQAQAMLVMLNSIEQYLIINSDKIDNYEFACDNRCLYELAKKLQSKINFCENKQKCISLKSFKFFDIYIYAKYAEKGVIQTGHPLCNSLHAKLMPVLQQKFL